MITQRETVKEIVVKGFKQNGTTLDWKWHRTRQVGLKFYYNEIPYTYYKKKLLFNMLYIDDK